MARQKTGPKLAGRDQTTGSTGASHVLQTMTAKTRNPRDDITSAERYIRGLLEKPRYLEYRGPLVPPQDIGSEGDIYIDEEAFKIYVREREEWKEVDKLDGTRSHPRLACQLWFNLLTDNFIGWFTPVSRRKTRYKAKEAGRGEIPEIEEAIERVLAADLPDEKQQKDSKRHRENRGEKSRPEKRAKTDAASHNSQSGSASTSAPQPASTSASQPASTSAPQPASTSGPQPVIDPKLLALSEIQHKEQEIPPQRRRASVTDLPEDVLIRGRIGIEFPEDIPVLSWRCGLKTASAMGDEQDDNAVRAMAQARDATKPGPDGSSPLVAVIEMPSEISLAEDLAASFAPVAPIVARSPYSVFLAEVRRQLSENRPVLVRGWKRPNPCQFTKEGLKSLRGSLDQRVQWQDVFMRANSRKDGGNPMQIHQHTSIEQFVDHANDWHACGNCLDLPRIRGACPPFVTDLDDGVRAWELTKDEFYGQSHSKKPNKQDKVNDQLTGPQVVRHDGQLVRDWDIATHGCFLTEEHQDASALNTFIYPHEGSIKLWGLIRVVIDEADGNREKVCAKHARVRGADNLGLPGSFTEEAVVTLMAGDVLLQPPGYWHRVFTPIKSIVSGGHFYLYDNLHLTEFCQSLHHTLALSATNAEHRSTFRTLCRMILALSKVPDDRNIPLRPVLALARIVCNREAYEPEIDSCAPGLQVRPSDLLGREELGEERAAVKIADEILACCEMNAEQARSIVEKGGQEWDHPGIDLFSTDHLRDQLSKEQ